MDQTTSPTVNQTTTPSSGLRIVAIGGGVGTSMVIQGAASYFADRTAIVSVTDSGRSTGFVRKLAQIPAPGDLRNTIATLAEDPHSLLPRLLQYRFVSQEEPRFHGMAFGNLMLAALAQMTGDIAQAVALLTEMVGVRAKIFPVSTANVHLCAELMDGEVVYGELAVRGVNKAPIRRVFLSDAEAPAYPPALKAVTEADIVVLGPGSFYTSVLANLLFTGMREALHQTRGVVVFVCNTTTQPGQTDHYRARDHVMRLLEVVGAGVVHVALINRSDDRITAASRARYAAEGVHVLEPDDEELARIAETGVQPLVNHYLETPAERRRDLWEKQDTIRHDPALLGKTLWEVAQRYGNANRQ